ncbi:hypothetical protein BC826DRAFT_1173601 [Russula brevipes]|nr:hypothetical protein BC826DRAFT_1173601 [Russula brevipes]
MIHKMAYKEEMRAIQFFVGFHTVVRTTGFRKWYITYGTVPSIITDPEQTLLQQYECAVGAIIICAHDIDNWLRRSTQGQAQRCEKPVESPFEDSARERPRHKDQSINQHSLRKRVNNADRHMTCMNTRVRRSTSTDSDRQRVVRVTSTNGGLASSYHTERIDDHRLPESSWVITLSRQPSNHGEDLAGQNPIAVAADMKGQHAHGTATTLALVGESTFPTNFSRPHGRTDELEEEEASGVPHFHYQEQAQPNHQY